MNDRDLSSRRVLLYTLAMGIAGVAPALLSVVGFWHFLQRGVVLSRAVSE